jgi:hypothetical protein
MLNTHFKSFKIYDNITFYSLLCLELPLHIAFKNDMLAVSNLPSTVRLHSSDTLTFLLSQQPAKLSSLPSDRESPTMRFCLQTTLPTYHVFSATALITLNPVSYSSLCRFSPFQMKFLCSG